MRLAVQPLMLPWRSVLKMVRERVIAQVKPRLRHCLEQRDRPGILSLTTWLVHRHGHALLQQLLSQPEWSGHRLWWAEQIHHLNLGPDPRPQSDLQPRPHPGTAPADKDRQDDQTRDKVPIVPRSTANQPAPIPPPVPELQERRPPLDGHPADPAGRTEPLEPVPDPPARITPAQVTKQRLKAGQAAKPAFRPGADGEIPIAPSAAGKEPLKRTSPGRQHRSRHLRSWLPHSRLPHQDAA
ncbi:MAG: hypothetical protein OXE74_00675 [Cyanobacteria bacterium MAG CAR2_bin_4]|nr:hypothetical protein [Cyanobacteria bacterium MAG CAR2_bin_4]